ncbi:MAG: hypothetical protein R2784_14805 [Saprospiraceae bacterium]
MPTIQLLLSDNHDKISDRKKDQILSILKRDDLNFDLHSRKKILENQPKELKLEISDAIAILRNRPVVMKYYFKQINHMDYGGTCLGLVVWQY